MMHHLFRNRDYTRLFAAQVAALSGTGLLSVGLGLLAYDLAGGKAGLVLGMAYTIKMVAYVGLSPLAQALVQRLPRKTVLIAADMVRAAVALCLPVITEIWQVYALIFVLQAASATFTPAYQAVLPDILPDERDYTRALSLSRMAYDLENLMSPALAGLILLLTSYHALFVGTGAGFLLSAALVAGSTIPPLGQSAATRPFRERLTGGLRLYLATPRLRGLLALTLAGAAISAFVLVNTVVLVRDGLGGGESGLALAMAAFGAGSMVAALVLPRLLDHLPDRPVMLAGAAGLAGVALIAGVVLWRADPPGWGLLLALWTGLGLLYSATLTPGGRLLRRSAGAEERQALFAAQFALSHLCWLLCYPLAGWAGQALGLGPTLVLMAALAALGLGLARRFWPREEAPRNLDNRAPL